MNLLSQETSPYLRQHMDNPVHWMPWGDAAFAKARETGKPVLLSIGYAACHWCHVMAEESFEDAGTADLMNTHFINIKVDREERPDVDALFQSALSLMGQTGGWPLTVFLTPDGRPFWGGTYFPSQPRFGMPSFREVLRGIATAYADEGDKITHNADSLNRALVELHKSQPGRIVRRDVLDRITGHFLAMIDHAHGGIGDAPKFPNLTMMGLLWDSYIRTGDADYKSAVIHSLIQMCQGGIYDHVGGGFARYATDAEWLVPHFEKMLYDNALFVSILTEVYRETRHPLFARRVHETIGWLLEDMTVKHQDHYAFTASFDADSNGHEGSFYVWSIDEVEEILGDDAETFCHFYDVTRFGNWQGTNILNRLSHPDYLSTAEEDNLSEKLLQLKTARRSRPAPARDDKILADWNGLMITALARAGDVFGEESWINAAKDAFGFITRNMTSNTGHLHHVWCDGCATQPATLEDYANMADAALALYDVTQDHAYIAQAIRWKDIADRDYWDTQDHGYFMTPATQGLPLRPKTAHDTATPNGQGTMIAVHTKIYHLTGDTACLDRAEKTAAAFAGALTHQTFPFATLLRAGDFFLTPIFVCIIGTNNTDGFTAVLKNMSLPHALHMVTTDANTFPKGHPAFGKTMVNGATTAYVCFGQKCLPPLTTPDELETLLREMRHTHGRDIANDG